MIYLVFVTVGLALWLDVSAVDHNPREYTRYVSETAMFAALLLAFGLFPVFISNSIYYNTTKEQVVTVESVVYTDLQPKAFELNLAGATVFEFILESEDGTYETLRVGRDYLEIVYTDDPVAKIQGVENVPSASKGFWYHLFGAPWGDDLASGFKSYILFVPVER